MGIIPDTSFPGRLYDRGNMADTPFSYQTQKQSVQAHESLRASLTIQTREGDMVTLSSNKFSEFSAFEYTRKGEIQSQRGTALVSHHRREITLTTGEQFSFSVQGDLNEQELSDIEAIVKGIDRIMAEMVQGDMEEAIEKALSMGSYTSVSMYSADISHERSYAVSQETRSASQGILPDQVSDQARARTRGQSPKAVDHFFDKMARLLEKQEEKMLAKARLPLASLFEKYLQKSEDTHGKNFQEEASLKTLAQQIDQMVADQIQNAFGKTFRRIG